MRRRAIIAAVPAACALLGGKARAQATGPMIGVLLASPIENLREEIAAFIATLAELGWRNARAPRLVVLSANDDFARLPGLAATLATVAPAVVVTQLSESALAMANATASIPIVLATGSDVIELGLTVGFARPSRNVTGFTNFNAELSAKRIELLLDVVPHARIGLIWDPSARTSDSLYRESVRAAATAGVTLIELPVLKDGDIPTAFERGAAANVEALSVIPAPVIGSNIDLIVEQAVARHWPAVFGYITFARHGGLITYAVDTIENYRGAARYVDRLLRGATVVDLPFQDPVRIKLIVNLATARRMHLTLPPSLFARADEVIE